MVAKVVKEARLVQCINPTDQRYIRQGLANLIFLASLTTHSRERRKSVGNKHKRLWSQVLTTSRTSTKIKLQQQDRSARTRFYIFFVLARGGWLSLPRHDNVRTAHEKACGWSQLVTAGCGWSRLVAAGCGGSRLAPTGRDQQHPFIGGTWGVKSLAHASLDTLPPVHAFFFFVLVVDKCMCTYML